MLFNTQPIKMDEISKYAPQVFMQKPHRNIPNNIVYIRRITILE